MHTLQSKQVHICIHIYIYKIDIYASTLANNQPHGQVNMGCEIK